MRRLTFLLLFFFTVGLLAACGQPNPTAKIYTETDLAAAVTGMSNDWESFNDPVALSAVQAASQAPINQNGCPTLEDIFTLITFESSALASQSLKTLAGYSLARGTYTYDPSTGACTQTADTDNLVFRYPYYTLSGTAADAELDVDWGDTLDVAGRDGELVEVPTAMTASLSADGQKVAAVSADLNWYNAPDCGSADGILEPTSVLVSGNVGSVTFTDVGYSLSDTALKVQGAVAAGSELSADFSVSVAGTLSRGPCFVDSFKADSGSLSFGAASTMTDESHSFRVTTNFSDIVFADFDVMFEEFMAGNLQGITSVRLSDGTVTIDAGPAATFDGVLDDANANHVPGENVTIQFSGGGTSTLEAYLKSYGFDMMPTSVVTKALAPR